MEFHVDNLKRTVAGMLACGVLLLAGAGLETLAQKPHKEHQKTERRELREHQRYERRTYGTSRTLRRHQKAEKRALKADHKTEKRAYKSERRAQTRGSYINNGRRRYRTNRPIWARARQR
ncbi:MAG TPA: hypothetical protein VGB76_12865 [Pyrinomonadaceae bacterium]|jgi:Ni/Co efflux regulator RcnB